MVDEKTSLLPTRRVTKQSGEYYRKLDELLQNYREDDEAVKVSKRLRVLEEQNRTKSDNLLSKIVLGVNVVLLIGKAVATYLTGGSSLSIISTLLDSVVDITSGAAIWYATYAIMHTDMMQYPRGRQNLEAMSIIFIGICMGMANFFVVFESVVTIVSDKPPPEITIASLSIIMATIVIKAILWFICVRKGTSTSLVLSIDQRNDVFTNFVAVVGAVLSQVWTKTADPIAAALISGYIAVNWWLVVIDQVPPLVGVKSSSSQFSRVARILINYSDKVRCLDTLLIYHTGNKVRVEAHVVLDPEMKSRIVHDEVVEPLKAQLERLPFVERAFIHPDYECDGSDD